jgi:adenylate cyclase
MTKETPRQLAICSHVLNNNSKPLVISDVSIDERTKHAYALAPGFPRFYAGSPIISKSGFTLGTFCVFDDKPKTLEHSKIEALRMLADQFMNIYESSMNPISYDSDISNDSEKIIGEYYSSSTILFSDFVGFTKKTEELEPGQLIEILDSFFSGFDKIMERFSIKKIKTIGDAYMAAGGIPDLNSNHADRTVMAAIEMINYVRGINFQQKALGNEPWEIRIGIHTGPIIAEKHQVNLIYGETL